MRRSVPGLKEMRVLEDLLLLHQVVPNPWGGFIWKSPCPWYWRKKKTLGVEALELEVSGGRDDYMNDGVTGQLIDAPQFGAVLANQPIIPSNNKVSSTDPTLALRYEPVRDLALRASFGTGFLPPT